MPANSRESASAKPASRAVASITSSLAPGSGETRAAACAEDMVSPSEKSAPASMSAADMARMSLARSRHFTRRRRRFSPARGA